MKRTFVFFFIAFLTPFPRPAFAAGEASPPVLDRQIKQEEEALRKLDQRYEAILREKMKLDEQIGEKDETIMAVSSGEAGRAPAGQAVKVGSAASQAQASAAGQSMTEQEFLRAQKEKELRLADEERMRGKLAAEIRRQESEQRRLDALRQKEVAEQERKAKKEDARREKEALKAQRGMLNQRDGLTKEQKQFAYFLKLRELQDERNRQSEVALQEMTQKEGQAVSHAAAAPAASPAAPVVRSKKEQSVNTMMDSLEKTDSWIKDNLW